MLGKKERAVRETGAKDNAPELVDVAAAQPKPEPDEVARLEGEIARLDAQRAQLDTEAQAVVVRDPEAAAELDAKASGMERTIGRLRKALSDERARQEAAEREADVTAIQNTVQVALGHDAATVETTLAALRSFVSAWNVLARLSYAHRPQQVPAEWYPVMTGPQIIALIAARARRYIPGGVLSHGRLGEHTVIDAQTLVEIADRIRGGLHVREGQLGRALGAMSRRIRGEPAGLEHVRTGLDVGEDEFAVIMDLQMRYGLPARATQPAPTTPWPAPDPDGHRLPVDVPRSE